MNKPDLSLAERVWSKSERRWFPIIERLDDDVYYARVWDEDIQDSFAITREAVMFDILNESTKEAFSAIHN